MKVIGRIHILALTVVFIFLGMKSFLTFCTSYDFLLYHLPFALDFFNLTTFIPCDSVLALKAGFPLLAEYLQGLLIFISGKLSFASSLNFIGLLLVVLLTKLNFSQNFSVRWFLSGCLAIPLFQFHITSGYIDLWTGLWLFYALTSLQVIEIKNRNRAVVTYCIGAGIACMSKMQAWPISIIIAVGLLWRLRKEPISVGRFVLITALMFSCIAVWPIKNILVNGNPVYPYKFPVNIGIFSNYFPERSIEIEEKFAKSAPLANMHQPQIFLFSVMEINRFFDVKNEYKWKLDNYYPVDSYNSRMGGFSPVFIIIGTWALVLLIRRAHSLSAINAAKIDFRLSKYLYNTFFACILITSLIPMGHNLRYALFIPLTLAWCISLIPAGYGKALRALLLLTAVITSMLINPFFIDSRKPFEHAPQKAKNFWQTASKHTRESPKQIHETPNVAIYFSGPEFNSFWVKPDGWGVD